MYRALLRAELICVWTCQVIQPLLPLPYLRTGYLQAVHPASEPLAER